MPGPTTAAEFKEQLGAEYGVYTALGPIDINGARAFNTGDAVPVSHVERGIVEPDRVAKNTTKAAAAALDAVDPVEPDQVAKNTTKAASVAITKES